MSKKHCYAHDKFCGSELCPYYEENIPKKETIMEFKFKCDSKTGYKVYVYSDNVSLTDILEDFENFLRACGYEFEGQIEIVEKFKYEGSSI